MASIEISAQTPVARVEMEVRQRNGDIKRVLKRLGKDSNLFVESKELDQYRGFLVSQIDAHADRVAETKGSVSSMELRTIEQTKIACARKFFAEINRKVDLKQLQYDVVDSFAKLMEVVKGNQARSTFVPQPVA